MPRRKKSKVVGADLPIKVPVRYAGRVVAHVVVTTDWTVSSVWSANLDAVPWEKGERERLAWNATEMAKAMCPDVFVTHEQVYAALWPKKASAL